LSETLNIEDDSVKDRSLWKFETELFLSLPYLYLGLGIQQKVDIY
jgi:hypothetical protein